MVFILFPSHDRGVPNVGGIVAGSVKISAAPIGVHLRRTTYLSLGMGDMFIGDYDHDLLVKNGFIPGTWYGFSAGFYTLNIKVPGPPWTLMDIWKMEFVY